MRVRKTKSDLYWFRFLWSLSDFVHQIFVYNIDFVESLAISFKHIT